MSENDSGLRTLLGGGYPVSSEPLNMVFITD
jgi:hypothetical protein